MNTKQKHWDTESYSLISNRSTLYVGSNIRGEKKASSLLSCVQYGVDKANNITHWVSAVIKDQWFLPVVVVSLHKVPPPISHI